MVSGLVTSPIDQSRICFGEARPIRIASKSLMSICAKVFLLRSDALGRRSRRAVYAFSSRRHSATRSAGGSVLHLEVCGQRELLVARALLEVFVRGEARVGAVLRRT